MVDQAKLEALGKAIKNDTMDAYLEKYRRSRPASVEVEFVRSLRQLWRHRLFRRLLAVRVATQTADGVLQVALASFVLFSPQRQPDAASVAAVLAITLLPFSVLGPFVGVVLDRWSRRQILVVLDLARCRAGRRAGGPGRLRASGPARSEAAFYGGVLLAMSLEPLPAGRVVGGAAAHDRRRRSTWSPTR